MNESEGNRAAEAARSTLRDPWAWASALAVLPLVFLTRGTPRGEPVAEDFDMLRHALLGGSGSWLDGGGGQAFWRPLAHQAYFGLFGELLLAHPARVAALQAALLAVAAVLVYRALRPAWPAPHAAVATTFPLLTDASRSLVCWASHSADLGAILFLAIAIHERSRRRLATGLLAAAAALLSKEVAVAGVVLLPFFPDERDGSAAVRRRWLWGCALLVAAWAAAYAMVRNTAGLALPHGLESGAVSAPAVTRIGWALGRSLAVSFGLPLAGWTPWLAVAAVLALVLFALRAARDPAAMARLRGRAAWGGAYALAGWLALTPIFPLWSPYRALPGSAGLGLAVVSLAGAAHPALPLAIGAGRLALLGASPGTPARITPEPEDRGAFMDYPKLSRLELLMRASRTALMTRFPTLPHGSLFAWHDLPLSAEYAFGGSLALEVWYRDTTLRMTTLEAFAADSTLPVRAFLSYQPRHLPQVVLVEPAAERWKLRGVDALRAGRWDQARAAFDRADSAEADRRALVFLGDVAGRRALALAHLDRWGEAERDARFALSAAAEDVGARYVLASALARRRETRAALGEIDALLAIAPGDEDAIALRRALATRLASETR